MNKKSLVGLLNELAEKDLEDGADIFDHPCTVAVRAIEQCFEDIVILKKLCNETVMEMKVRGRSKRVQTLVKLNYDPSW